MTRQLWVGNHWEIGSEATYSGWGFDLVWVGMLSGWGGRENSGGNVKWKLLSWIGRRFF